MQKRPFSKKDLSCFGALVVQSKRHPGEVSLNAIDRRPCIETARHCSVTTVRQLLLAGIGGGCLSVCMRVMILPITLQYGGQVRADHLIWPSSSSSSWVNVRWWSPAMWSTVYWPLLKSTSLIDWLSKVLQVKVRWSKLVMWTNLKFFSQSKNEIKAPFFCIHYRCVINRFHFIQLDSPLSIFNEWTFDLCTSDHIYRFLFDFTCCFSSEMMCFELHSANFN